MSDDTRVALVTGGTRGIGLGICRALAQEGVSLVLNGLRAEAAITPVLDELSAIARSVRYVQADIAQTEQREHLVRAVQEQFGRLDILVNNAGAAPAVRADILEVTEESFARIMAVNLRGPYFLTQAVARLMIQQRERESASQPVVINITSVSAETPSTNRGDYCMAKAAMSMASKLWAVRLAEYGIPVYEIRPGIIRTDMTAGATEKYDRLIRDGLLLEPRWGTPEDVGRAVAMLVRGDLPYATGAVLKLDGGLSISRL